MEETVAPVTSGTTFGGRGAVPEGGGGGSIFGDVASSIGGEGSSLKSQAYGMSPILGLGLDILGLVGTTYNQIIARREAQEAKDQYNRDYKDSLAREITLTKQKQANWEQEFGLRKDESKETTRANRQKYLNTLSRQREEDKQYWDKTSNDRYQQYQEKWLGMMNDPNAKAGFLSAMKGR